MNFKLEKSIEILERTPNVLMAMLHGISVEWTSNNEGEKTWSAYDVVGHLIHGEKTDWIPRADIILSKNPGQKFESFDRFAQFEDSKGKSISQLLDEFKICREKNIAYLVSRKVTDEQLGVKGIHPDFGEVTYLNCLLRGWYTILI